MLEYSKYYVDVGWNTIRSMQSIWASRFLAVMQCIRCMEDGYMKDITCLKTSEELGISESYLAKLFKRETGYTFVDYLTHIRMKKAIHIMEKDHPKIYELHI